MRAYDESNDDPAGNSWLKAYVAHQRYSESPLAFHFWTGVATIAGALRRRVWIDQRHFQWTPNMYIILVGPPGVAAKSTSIRAGLSLLEAVPGIHFGPQSMTWQALIESFKQAKEDISISGLEKPVSMSCLTIGAGELGTFFDPANKEFADLLTAIWDGQKETLRRRTVGGGETVISNPWLNLIACTTPSWLRERFPEVMVGGGLTSRIVFVYGQEKRQLIPYPSRMITDKAYDDETQWLISDLSEIAQLGGEYKLSPDAYSWGETWYAHHNNGGLPAHLASGRYDGYLSRKQTHIHKLAIILAAAKRSDLTITKEDLQEAEGHVSALEHDMIRVFSSIGVSQTVKTTGEVLTLIKNHRSINSTALWKLCFHSVSQPDFVNSVKAAVDAGYVRKESVGDGTFKLTYLGEKR